MLFAPLLYGPGGKPKNEAQAEQVSSGTARRTLEKTTPKCTQHCTELVLYCTALHCAVLPK